MKWKCARFKRKLFRLICIRKFCSIGFEKWAKTTTTTARGKKIAFVTCKCEFDVMLRFWPDISSQKHRIKKKSVDWTEEINNNVRFYGVKHRPIYSNKKKENK